MLFCGRLCMCKSLIIRQLSVDDYGRLIKESLGNYIQIIVMPTIFNKGSLGLNVEMLKQKKKTYVGFLKYPIFYCPSI